MFQQKIHRSKTSSLFGTLAVTYYTVVNDIRGGHRNAVVGILLDIMRSLIMVAVFYVMFQLLGVRSSPVRGDFIIYIMSGVFLYRTHIQAVTAVSGAVNPVNPIMLHSPMSPFVALAAAAFGSLYKQTFAIIIILVGYHLIVNPIEIDYPIHAYGMLVIAWASGCAAGVVLGALTPWLPNFAPLLKRFYIRANMIASGKMFLANTLPASMVALFDWNPLFHAIDQARGFAFLHYSPMHSSISYPIILTLVVLLIGLLGEFYTRQNASVSWFAGR